MKSVTKFLFNFKSMHLLTYTAMFYYINSQYLQNIYNITKLRSRTISITKKSCSIKNSCF